MPFFAGFANCAFLYMADLGGLVSSSSIFRYEVQRLYVSQRYGSRFFIVPTGCTPSFAVANPLSAYLPSVQAAMVKRKIANVCKSDAKSSKEKSTASSSTHFGPSCAELGEVFIGKRSQTSHEETGKTNVFLPVIRYNTDASIYGPLFAATAMCVLFCMHEQRPSVFYKFIFYLQMYIETRHQEDSDFPPSIKELEQTLACKFVIARGDHVDEDKHFLFKPWRIAIYMNYTESVVKEVLIFLDAFVYWVATECDDTSSEFDSVPKIDIQLPVGFNVELTESADGGGDMECPFQLTNSDDYQVKPSDAPPPCFPPRMLVAVIEAPSKNTVSIVWQGNTMPFREGFEELQIGGIRKKVKESDKFGEYYRKKENMSIREPADMAAVLDLFGERLTKLSPVVVKLRNPPKDDDVFQNFVSRLKEFPHCFFV